MAEYGATSNYKLPFPTDDAPTDIAGDIKNLALGVDNAIGLNWDTATDEQKAAVGNATAPVRLFGSGRPDGLGDPSVSYNNTAIAAPTGSTYTWTGDDPDAVFGAAVWRKGDDWVCVEGMLTTKATRADGSFCEYSRQGTVVTVISKNVARVESNESHWQIESSNNGSGTWLWYTGDKEGSCFWQRDSQRDVVVRTGDGTSVGQSDWVCGTWVATGPWPTSDPVVDATVRLAELRELIEAAQDPDHPNHDQLLQLKEELANLTGTKPGDVS